MIRVAVIGCGKIGTRHLDAYRSIEDATIAAVCDTDEKLAKEAAKYHNATSYTNLKDVLDDETIDAVDVCVPTAIHHTVILEALDRGKAIFCEKPLSHRLELAKQIEKKRKETGNLVMVGYLYRFHPSFQRLKRVLQGNIIGDPYFAIFRIGGRGGWREWKHQMGKGGGAMLEMLVHMLDLANHCFGEILEVESLFSDTILKKRVIERNEVEVDAEDCVLIRLRAENDVHLFCEADLITPSYMNTVEVHGDNGSFFGSILDNIPTIIYCKETRGMYDRGKNIFRNPYVNLVEKELDFFIHCLSREVKPMNSVEESIKILGIVEQVRRQSRRRS
ncbi:MAG: Gfo/Idh/MocA family oxidoreductase [Candidatus Bathyarchaeota archaeon]|nr:MAG: Gfo/Idh/MocA family oxidoreductase [Candidatus Bathyarchaeota archaeon]